MSPTEIVLNVQNGGDLDIYCSDVAARVLIVDWDVQHSDPDAPGIIELPTGTREHNWRVDTSEYEEDTFTL